MFFITTQPEKFKGNHTFYYLGIFFLLLFGAYGLYKLRNRNKIVTIDTVQPLTKKKAAFETFLSQMNVVTDLNDNYYLFTYRKGFWNSPIDVYLFYDENSIRFSVQGQDYYDGGFIDFGGTEKLRKKIADDLQTLLI